MDIIIRQVMPEDLDAVARVEAVCFPKAEAASRVSFAQRIRMFPECFFVAEREGEIIGFINGCATDSPVISDEMFEEKAAGGFWEQRIESHKKFMELQQKAAARRRMLMKLRMNGGSVSAAELLMGLISL